MDYQTFRVDSIAYGAKGIARQDGKVFFIRDTVPGDEVQGQILSDKGRYGEVKPEHFLHKSALRQPSPCLISSVCGGCQWLEIDYPKQLEWKEQFLRAALTRIGKVEGETAVEVWPAKGIEHYRNRIRLRGRPQADGHSQLGYYAAGTRDFVGIPTCYIAAPSVQEFLKAWQRTPPKIAVPFQMEIGEIMKDQVLITLLKDGDSPDAALKKVARFCSSLPGVAWAGLRTETAEAGFFAIEEHLGLKFFVRPGQFYQVQLQGNQRLREAVKDFAAEIDAHKILDAYCGSGNLSLALGAAGRRILGVEANGNSIAAAAHTVKINAIPGDLRYVKGDAAGFLKRFALSAEPFDLILADPPREGLGEALRHLAKIQTRGLVLIGCEPNHFARDLGRLLTTGYRLKRLVMADFFPGTYHLESIAFLVK